MVIFVKALDPIPDYMYSLSSATIPDDMTMSCCSIIEKFEDLEASQSEKDVLLRRLGELIETEREQVKAFESWVIFNPIIADLHS